MIKGSITIYLLLSLLLVLAVICTLTESARVCCINARLRSITYMAADSCFAEYAREVFDEYGIMALWMDDAQFVSSFNGYVRKNLDYSDLNISRDIDMELTEHEQSAVGDVVRLTDNHGECFNMQVYEYMDYYPVTETSKKILPYIDLYAQGEKAGAFLEQTAGYSDVFLKAADSAAKIQDIVDRVKSSGYNPGTILSNMYSSLNSYLLTEDDFYISEFNQAYRDLMEGKDALIENMKQIEDRTELFHKNAGEARKALGEMQKILDEEGKDYDPELKNALQEQMDDLAVKASDTQNDYYQIEKNSIAAGRIKEKTGSLNSLPDSIPTLENGENAGAYCDILSGYQNWFDDADISDLGLNMKEYSGKKADSGFISVISSLFSEGLPEAAAGNRISENSLETESLPSAGTNSSGEKNSGFSETGKDPEFAEYIIRHFGCFTSLKKDTALNYEAEYIIAGKNSDAENLRFIVRKLALIRAGLNLTGFMKDPEKMQEAQLLAESLTGFTGTQMPVRVTKMVIISLWCLAEAMCDVKALLAGERIPAIRDPGNWAISSAGLTAFRKDFLPAVTDENGLSYDDHLRILLLLENPKDRTFRTMDLIQANMCRKYNSRFRMKECIASVKIYVSYSARALFALFGFVRKIAGGSGQRYSFRFTQDYQYTDPA